MGVFPQLHVNFGKSGLLGSPTPSQRRVRVVDSETEHLSLWERSPSQRRVVDSVTEHARPLGEVAVSAVRHGGSSTCEGCRVRDGITFPSPGPSRVAVRAARCREVSPCSLRSTSNSQPPRVITPGVLGTIHTFVTFRTLSQPNWLTRTRIPVR